ATHSLLRRGTHTRDRRLEAHRLRNIRRGIRLGRVRLLVLPIRTSILLGLRFRVLMSRPQRPYPPYGQLRERKQARRYPSTKTRNRGIHDTLTRSYPSLHHSHQTIQGDIVSDWHFFTTGQK